jgi:competence CoiA-like predicted nuclease
MSSGERVDITQHSVPQLKAFYRPGQFVCQLCGQPLSIRQEHLRGGSTVSPHFFHLHQCVSDYDAHPESAEHRFGKLWLRDYLHELYQVEALNIELEVPVRMDWRARGRIADLLINWPMGWREAHEIQLASITTDQLEEHTNDYLRCGIEVYWWLGNNAAKKPNTEWCLHRFGVCRQIDMQPVPFD